MKKASAIAVPLVTILLLVELASANPIDNSANPDFHDVTMKPVAGASEYGIDFTGPSSADFDADFAATNLPDDTKIVEDLNSEESNRVLTSLWPVSEAIHGVVPNLKPGFERPSRVPGISKTDPEKPDSFVAGLKPDSWAADSLLTTVAGGTISGGNVGSLVTSLEPGSGGPDSLATTMEPDIFSTIRDIGSGEPGSLSTTLESGSKRRGGLTPTLTPGPHDPGNKLTNEPVTKESRNGAAGFRSSCTMVLLVTFLIAGSQITHKIS